MAKFDNTELYQDQIVEFTFEGQDYTWEGDYEVREWGETSTYYYPGDYDREVRVIYTRTLEYYDYDQDVWIRADSSHSILTQIEIEIEKTL